MSNSVIELLVLDLCDSHQLHLPHDTQQLAWFQMNKTCQMPKNISKHQSFKLFLNDNHMRPGKYEPFWRRMKIIKKGKNYLSYKGRQYGWIWLTECEILWWIEMNLAIMLHLTLPWQTVMPAERVLFINIEHKIITIETHGMQRKECSSLLGTAASIIHNNKCIMNFVMVLRDIRLLKEQCVINFFQIIIKWPSYFTRH